LMFVVGADADLVIQPYEFSISHEFLVVRLWTSGRKRTPSVVVAIAASRTG
jgi:hypothetical protein